MTKQNTAYSFENCVIDNLMKIVNCKLKIIFDEKIFYHIRSCFRGAPR